MIQFLSTVLSFIGLVVVIVALILRRQPSKYAQTMSRWTLGQAGLQKRSVDSGEGAQVVWQAGRGQVVVLLHGEGDQAGIWAKALTEFPRSQYQLLIPDLAGHGESAPVSGPLSMATMLAGLKAVLAPHGSVILVGHSMSAWLAMLYAGENPGQVSRVVAVNGGPLRGLRTDVRLLPQDRAEARRLMEAMRDPGSERIADYVLDDLVRSGVRGPLARVLTAQRDSREVVLESHLAAFPVEVDLIWGESDQLMPLAFAEQLKAELPGARLTTIPKCGHVPHQERPQEFARVLAKVLARTA
ncbi:alpha/beta fold hydrolase [Paludibaculum fermentans]|uniref:Alpha/beta hydrolase n=1 Tax=Paludibaculum fermentans TaxID=1473598 RepID=A0A7S7NV83_PALFE|nr:alpha/beta hydrolase [Paludibaculum fermentans]QOY89819.1 alpha/beta hydrolase [Paludibaculum fermentans]